jgi:CheY-like chemotaxis protein
MFTQGGRREERGGGLGIGLALSRALVEMHHGTISAASAGLGRGSTFTIRLPLAPERMRPATDDVVGGAQGASVAAYGRVLIADDHKDTADSMATLLRLDGYEVHVARDGIDAVDMAARVQPEIVLLDLGMPRIDGWETARRIREMPWAADAILIAITGWGQPLDRERSRNAGFTHHLVKPVDTDTLRSLIKGSNARQARG